MRNWLSFSIIALFIQLTVVSQPNSYPDSINSLLNVNGAILPSTDFFNNIPEMEMTAKSDSTLLQMKVYNDEHPFFPPIFLQQGGSCVQSAEIGYCFTYEINRARSVSAGDWKQNKNNCYHPLFTYNFLNEGTAYTGTDYTSGFRILKETGCPSLSDFYDPILDDTTSLNKFKYWMTGRTKYLNSMPNKIFDYYVIHFNYTYSSLNPLKHWLSDHGEGDIIGGVAIMGVYTSGWNPFGQIPNDSPEEPGLQMVSSWGSSTGNGHALTIVGYNDNIWCFDINNDGLYTIDQDVNGDSIVDLHDCEKGALR